MIETERPPGGKRAAEADNLGSSEQPDITANPPAPQARRLQRPKILAHVEHSATAAIEITRSRDGGRLTIAPLTRIGDGPWLPAGAAPSLAVALLDATIEALQRARAAIGGR